jgi:hypothetical protein
MSEQIDIAQHATLRTKQIMAVATRSVVVNLLVVPVWTICCSLIFIFSAVFLNMIFRSWREPVNTIMLLGSFALCAFSTGYVGYLTASIGQGPLGKLTHKKVQTFAKASALNLSFLFAYCGYLVMANIWSDANRYIAFMSFVVMMGLPIYVFGQSMAIVVNARKLKSSIQLKKGP